MVDRLAVETRKPVTALNPYNSCVICLKLIFNSVLHAGFVRSVELLTIMGIDSNGRYFGDSRIYGYKKKESNCLKSNDISI